MNVSASVSFTAHLIVTNLSQYNLYHLDVLVEVIQVTHYLNH